MTVRKGEAWGTVAHPPRDLIRVADDRSLHALLNEHRRTNRALPPVAPASGDLLRALGGTGDAGRLQGSMAIVPVDVVRVESEGERAWFVSHLVARRSWWRGRLVAAVNGQYLGAWDVAPRAHPGDGRVDVLTVDAGMRLRDRLQARRRLEHGLHLPHPAIDVRQQRATTIALQAGSRIWLDGIFWRRASEVSVTVEPDGLIVCV